MAPMTVGHVRASSLIWALRRVWELPPELCKITVQFWESRHVANYGQRVMMELEALCVRVALMASCSLSKATRRGHSGSFSFEQSVGQTIFDRPSPLDIPLFHLPESDVVMALDARVRQLPFLGRYMTPVCHPDSSVDAGKCKTCGLIDKASLLDAWAKFPDAYPDSHCEKHIFGESGPWGGSQVFQRVWQLCHAGGTGTSAEKIAEESGTIEDALRRSGCLLKIKFEIETRFRDLTFVKIYVLSVSVTETIRSTKTFEQTGVECLRDVAHHPKRTCGAPAVGAAKVRRVGE